MSMAFHGCEKSSSTSNWLILKLNNNSKKIYKENSLKIIKNNYSHNLDIWNPCRNMWYCIYYYGQLDLYFFILLSIFKKSNSIFCLFGKIFITPEFLKFNKNCKKFWNVQKVRNICTGFFVWNYGALENANIIHVGYFCSIYSC